MKIPLPNLDDRRWADLVEEGRSLIPLYAPDWTDHNVHDPGITLVELFAWITEMDIYQLNRIPDRHKLKFLQLAGVEPRPPRPACAVVGFTTAQGPVDLAATIEVQGRNVLSQPVRFRTLDAIHVVPVELKTVQIKDASGFHDASDRLARGEPFDLFGAVPERGAEAYFGFNAALPFQAAASLYFTFAGGHSGDDERRRLLDEVEAQRASCRAPSEGLRCKDVRTLLAGAIGAPASAKVEPEPPARTLPPHHGVRTEWEFLTSVGGRPTWLPLRREAKDVDDDTRAFTLDGRVLIKPPRPMSKASIGRVKEERYYVRCRFEAGAYDGPVTLRHAVMNGARVEQAVPVATSWELAKGAVVSGPAPAPGQASALRLKLDALGAICELAFESDAKAPQIKVFGIKPPTTTSTGALLVEAALLGGGTGIPGQQVFAGEAPVVESTFSLHTFEKDDWRDWALRADFDASGRVDRHFLLDPTTGTVTFGDGEHGLMPPKGCAIVAFYMTTRAEEGNLAAATILELADSDHNKPLVANLDALKKQLAVSNPEAAAGGARAETLEDAEGRAIDLVNTTERAVTLADYERLAKETPGARVARAAAIANLHPSFPCFRAPGLITLVVLPAMPVSRPVPSPGLRRLIAAYLHRRRVLGTRVEVVGPTYQEVTVRARVKALQGAGRTALQERIKEALLTFLDPLKGGPDGTGWPFGRDVYRAEVLQVIDETPGVDHVVSLEFLAGGCDPQCGNVCLAPTWLVASGPHDIEVI